jgi:ATP-binding cassette subfamily F protein uup
VEDYLARRRAAQAEAAGLSAARRAQGDTRAEARAARRELIRLERRIATLERQEVQLHEDLARHATDHERVLELDTRLREIGAEKDEAESAWLELAETAEAP